jgi:hypothetical protein
MRRVVNVVVEVGVSQASERVVSVVGVRHALVAVASVFVVEAVAVTLVRLDATIGGSARCVVGIRGEVVRRLAG